MSTKNLLVELFVEELPPKALKKLGEVFAQTLAQSLKNSGLAASTVTVTPYASPRRLAAHVTEVAAVAADKAVAQKLMPASVGLDANGNATIEVTELAGWLDAKVPEISSAAFGFRQVPQMSIRGSDFALGAAVAGNK